MSSSKSRNKRRDKYNPEPEKNFMIHRGQKVPLGGAAEMLRHCDAQWYAYLERLVNNPKEQNPFEHYEGDDLRQGLKDRGYIGKTQDQLRADSLKYAKKLEAGQEPYSDRELYRVGYLNDKGEMIDSQTGEVIPFVPVRSAN